MAKVALNLEDVFSVFSVFFDDVSVCIYCRRVVIVTFLATLTSKTFLILVFLVSLALVDRRLLVLATRYISRRNVSILSLSSVFFLFLCGLVLLKTL